MKRLIALQLVLWTALALLAQDRYSTDVGIVSAAEGQALQQAHAVLEGGANGDIRAALQAAIKEMERAQTALDAAKNSPDKLSAALAAEQSAYQALLKATPREYRMRRSRDGSAGGGSGEPNQQELDQVELAKDDNRYETEQQAKAAPTQQQAEQSQTLERLKQLARRQQDLNDRLRDLQNALQEAHTDQERQEIQRQLKRLRDEERQMLSDVDELRQQLEQSPNAEKQTDARRQLEQTHTDVQKAAQQLDNQAVSEALAARFARGAKTAGPARKSPAANVQPIYHANAPIAERGPRPGRQRKSTRPRFGHLEQFRPKIAGRFFAAPILDQPTGPPAKRVDQYS